MIVGIVCPKCKMFTTSVYPHPQNTLCFVCDTCQVILEMPCGIRNYVEVTKL